MLWIIATFTIVVVGLWLYENAPTDTEEQKKILEEQSKKNIRSHFKTEEAYQNWIKFWTTKKEEN